MKLKFIETTYICQLNKPENRKMLEDYVSRKDYSTKEFAHYYVDIVGALVDTPAWNITGVNKMINELTASARAKLARAKTGKTSAPAHARKLLSIIDFHGNKTAKAHYAGNYKLQPILTQAELQELEALEVVA